MPVVQFLRCAHSSEHNTRRVANGSIVAGEVETTGFAVHSKHRDIVRALIATIKELTSGVEIETSGIVAASPFVPDKCQFTVRADRENSDAVVQSIPCIDKPAIVRHQNLRAKIAARIPGWQTGNRLTCFELPGCRIVIKQDNRRAFLLD